jgi:uncharacterized protein (TIGR02246 family)
MSQSTSPVDFKAAIATIISEFENAADAKDAARIAKLYVEGATLMPPGAPAIRGRQNIQAFWKAFLEAGASDAKLRSVEVVALGDTAYEIGAFEANVPSPQGGIGRLQGKYVVIWKQQSDGNIQMLVDIFNMDS